MFHIPVQVFRALLAMIIAAISAKVLEVFRDELIDNLKESYLKIKEFNSNASHQLKTPLSSIKVQADVTLQKERSKEEYKNIIHSIGEEATSLQNIINNLLLLTRMDDQSVKEHFKDVEIDSVVLDVLGEYMKIAEHKKVNLIVNELDEVSIYAEKTLIHVMISNLIDNAVKYTPKDRHIYVTLKNKTLEIQDEGVGIAKKDLDKIFDKYFRVNSSLSEGNKGFGLGLPMVKKIADFHDLPIFVKSEINKGTIFTIKF